MSRAGCDRAIRVGLIGCGVVGTGILRLLRDNAGAIGGRLGAPIEVRAIAVRDASRARDEVVPTALLTEDALSVATHEEVDVVVEVVGGIEAAGRYVRAALEAGKHVVTANKALIAEEGDALLELAEQRGVDLYFEAAVAGGIPILRVLREGLASDRVVSVRGIVNGTSNYILSRMRETGLGFDQALAEAQARGYAEADPTLDVGGGDARHKLTILATLAFGTRVHPSQIVTEGIDRVSATDLRLAERFGYVIKPLAIARPVGERLELRVHPALLRTDDVLASVPGAMNAVHVEGAMLGPCVLIGPGAGATPTAMSVVSDVVDVGRNLQARAHGRVPGRAFRGEELRQLAPVPAEEHRTRSYLRFTVADRPGVLARIAGLLARFGVSIEEMVQQPSATADGAASLVMLTHEARWGDLRAALDEVDGLPLSHEPAHALRIES